MKAFPRVTRPAGAAASALVLLLLSALPARSQESKRVLDHDAYDVWRTIEGERISDDGGWVLYRLAHRVGDGEVVVVRSDGGAEYRVDRGDDARFSPAGGHAVFTIEPAYDSVRTLRLAKTERDMLPRDTLGILELATGDLVRIPRVRQWKLPADGGAVVAYLIDRPGTPPPEPEPDTAGLPPEPPPEPEPEVAGDSADAGHGKGEKPDAFTLVLRRLDTGAERRYPDVVAFELSRDGARLGYTAATEDGSGDGVYVVDTRTGEARPALTGEGLYERLTLSDDGRRIAFVTDRDDREAERPTFALYAARDDEEARRVAGTGTSGIPDGWGVSSNGALRFSESGDRLYFGTAPRPVPAPEEDSLLDEERVRLDVWSWQDDYLQPMQLLNADEEVKRTYRAVAQLDRGGRVVQLATPSLPRVELSAEGDGDIVLAETDVPYRRLVGIESPGYSDLWLIDVRDGSRRQVLEDRQIAGAELSPSGRWLAWYDFADRGWRAMATDGGDVVDLTAGVPFAVWDEEDDHPMLPGPYGAAGWTADESALLVYDRYDVWAVDPEGRRAPRSITEGYGRENGIRLRYVDLDPDEPTIESGSPILLSGFDTRRKDAGFFRDRVRGSEQPERLVFEPKRFGTPARARGSDALLYTREDVAEFPDLWVSDAWLGGGRRISHANPQQSEYNWATVELTEWMSTEGVPLQGLVYKPEDFDPSKTYPMIVYFYERNSDNLHEYAAPLPHRSVIRPTFYASRGYIVFIPDIVYQDGYPGESAMESVMPGTLKLAAEPWVDESNVGVQGHSWGGYQIAYMVTRTNFFKAAEAGAPVANMTSAYGGIRWGSGMSRMFQYERTQSRIGDSLWGETLRYLENSPLFYLDRVETPLLIMHNDGDTAVPWYQGIELFVGLRRLGKAAWLVNYNDQPHWPTTAADIRDWNIRMQQFFDHYLKGAPSPVWLAEGIPATEKGRTLGLDLVEPGIAAGAGGEPAGGSH